MPLVYRGDTPPTMKNGRECDGDSRPLRVPWRRSGTRPLRRTVSGSTVKHSSRRSTQKSLVQRASRSNPGGRAASNSRKLDTYGGTSVKFVCRSNGVLRRQYQDQAQCYCVLCRYMPDPARQAIFRCQFRFLCMQTVYSNKARSTSSRAAVCVAGRVIPAMCGLHKAKNGRNYGFARTVWESRKLAGPDVDAVFPAQVEKLAGDWSHGLGNETARRVSGGFAGW